MWTYSSPHWAVSLTAGTVALASYLFFSFYLPNAKSDYILEKGEFLFTEQWLSAPHHARRFIFSITECSQQLLRQLLPWSSFYRSGIWNWEVKLFVPKNVLRARTQIQRYLIPKNMPITTVLYCHFVSCSHYSCYFRTLPNLLTSRQIFVCNILTWKSWFKADLWSECWTGLLLFHFVVCLTVAP